MLPKSHACPAHGLSTHTWTREHTQSATHRETFAVSHSDMERCLTVLELSPSYSWRLPSGLRSLGFPAVPVFFLSSASQAGDAHVCPGTFSAGTCQPSRAPLLGLCHPHPDGKRTLPFQRSWWGQRQVAISTWGVGWESGCGDVGEG